MRRSACALAILLSTTLAVADTGDRDDESSTEAELVLLNATAKFNDLGKIDRIRRVLESKGMLAQLPARLEATLDGRNVLIADVDAIKEAYSNLDYDAALKIIASNEERILQGVTGGDPIPALVQLSEWRGLIASAQDDDDEAIRQFRAALRLNPGWSPDKRMSSPRIRKLVKKARKEVDETGLLRIAADPEDAMVEIDGGKPQPASEKITLPAGVHLVVISAEGRKTYAELVDIPEDETEKLEIALDPASKDDHAAMLVDATIAAAPGKARLKKVKKVSKYTGASRYLVIEDIVDDRVTVRLYDINSKMVSKAVDFAGNASSTAIVRKVMAALEPENMVEPSSVMIIESNRSQRWYERWYVWVGVGAVIGGGAIGYQYMTREPTSIRGF